MGLGKQWANTAVSSLQSTCNTTVAIINYCQLCFAPSPTHLDALITVVGGDDPVVCEDHVEGVAAPPPLELQRQRGVGLGVPLRHLLKPVQHVAWGGGGYIYSSYTLILLISPVNELGTY